MKCIFSILFLLITTIFPVAQDSGLYFEQTSDKLSFYADVLINASASENRIKANEQFYKLFSQELREESSFSKSFDYLKWITIVNAPDNSVRTISWQLEKSDSDFEYFSFIQLADGTFYEFRNYDGLDRDVEYEIMNHTNWYGSLVYRIEQFTGIEGKYYLLFTFHQKDKFSKVKTVDILTLTEDQPVFGKPLFVQKKEDSRDIIKNRLYLEYSSDSFVTMSYNPGINILLFDHLIPRMGTIPGQGPTLVSDGSYEGYILEDSQWVYKEKIYDLILEEAPRPKPIAKDRGTGLNKRKKNKN